MQANGYPVVGHRTNRGVETPKYLDARPLVVVYFEVDFGELRTDTNFWRDKLVNLALDKYGDKVWQRCACACLCVCVCVSQPSLPLPLTNTHTHTHTLSLSLLQVNTELFFAIADEEEFASELKDFKRTASDEEFTVAILADDKVKVRPCPDSCIP